MSIATIVQFAALAVIAGIGVCIVYVIFEMRTVYAEQRDKFLRGISAVEEFHKLQPEFVSVLKQIESDGHALQKIALQIEVAVAALKNAISSSVIAAADKQTAAIDDLRDHLDAHEVKLVATLERISETIRTMPPPVLASPPPAPPPPQPQAAPPEPEAKPENVDYVRLRKEVVGNDSQLRFSLLKEWVSINALAILRRASRGWTTPNDLIVTIPAHLEPEAEILNDRVLLIGTRGHTEKLAMPLGDLDPSSDLSQWFDRISNEPRDLKTPAVLVRNNGHFELISKGIAG